MHSFCLSCDQLHFAIQFQFKSYFGSDFSIHSVCARAFRIICFAEMCMRLNVNEHCVRSLPFWIMPILSRLEISTARVVWTCFFLQQHSEIVIKQMREKRRLCGNEVQLERTIQIWKNSRIFILICQYNDLIGNNRQSITALQVEQIYHLYNACSMIICIVSMTQ